MIKRRHLYYLLILVLLAACSDTCKTPFGEGGSIDITMPEFADLGNVGGAVVINRGYKGILVSRRSYNEFTAFECACPKCHDVRLEACEGWGYSIMQCPVCSSMFETTYGQPIDGAATPCPLYEYGTTFDGQIVSIY